MKFENVGTVTGFDVVNLAGSDCDALEGTERLVTSFAEQSILQTIVVVSSGLWSDFLNYFCGISLLTNIKYKLMWNENNNLPIPDS